MNEELKIFILSHATDTNNGLIECIMDGYKHIFESELLYKTHRGEVYQDGDKIIKHTTDKEEFENASKLVTRPSTHFVRYYSAKELGDGKYELVMDKVEHLNDNQEQMIELIMNSLGTEEYMLDDNKIYAFLAELKRNPDYYEDFATYKAMQSMLLILRRMYLEAKRRGITLHDLRADNMGTSNGNIVHFDLGAG